MLARTRDRLVDGTSRDDLTHAVMSVHDGDRSRIRL
jgi:hypothetical protein